MASRGTTRHGAVAAKLSARGITAVAPDLRGRGDSNTVNGPFGIASHARDVITLLDHLGLEQAIVVGH